MAKTKEELKEYLKNWKKNNPERNREHKRKYRLKFRLKNRLKNKFKKIKFYDENKVKKRSEKVLARRKLRDAVKLGKIKRLPCEVCGEIKSEGHHEDYLKPLEVKWLCMKHHRELHKKL